MRLWEDVQYGGNRGFLVVKTLPFHAATLPVIPFYLCIGNRLRKKCDTALQAVMFIPSLLIHIVLFVIVSSLLLPFAYLKMVIHKGSVIAKYRGRARCRMAARFTVSVFLGIPILAIRLVFDLGVLLYDDFKLTPLREQIVFQGVNLHAEVLTTLTNILESKINHKNIFEQCFTR